MKFGHLPPHGAPFSKSEPQVYREQLAQMRLADEIGFDWVWLTEHHFSSVPLRAERPRRVLRERIALCARLRRLPGHEARSHRLGGEGAAAGESAANGRGRGDGRHPERGARRLRDRQRIPQVRVRRTRDSHRGEGRAFRGGARHHPRSVDHGRVQLRGPVLQGAAPDPWFRVRVQKPHPPVWVATRLGTQEAIDFAAARGFRLLCAWAPRAELRKTHDQLVEAQSKLDIREPLVFTCLRHVFVAESDAIAKRDGEKYVEYYMNSTALFRPVGPTSGPR